MKMLSIRYTPAGILLIGQLGFYLFKISIPSYYILELAFLEN